MKKSLFILLIAVFLASCQGEFEDVNYTITNNSTKIVSFLFNDISETLNIDDSITYTINSEKGRIVPKNPTFTGHIRSVKLIPLNKGTSGIFYTFSDNNPLVLNVHNTLPIDLDLMAYDNLDFDINNFKLSFDINNFNYISDKDGNPTLKIKGNSSESAKIYTSTPFFIIKNGTQLYIADISWNLTNDTINVTIK